MKLLSFLGLNDVAEGVKGYPGRLFERFSISRARSMRVKGRKSDASNSVRYSFLCTKVDFIENGKIEKILKSLKGRTELLDDSLRE